MNADPLASSTQYEANPLISRDGEDDDPGQLRLTFSETVDPMSITGGSTLQSTSGGTKSSGSKSSASSPQKFNPHVTVGGTVHASSRLAVGRNGISYGADAGRFRLDPNDFAPLRVASDLLSSAPSSRDTVTLTEDGGQATAPATAAAAQQAPDAVVSTGNLLGRGASGSVRLMVHLPTARPVAVKSIATLEKHHFDEILSEIRALCDAKTAFDTALNSDSPLDFTTPDAPLAVPPTPSAPGFIVDFLGAWTTDGFVNIAMECMAGSLADIKAPPVEIVSRMTHMLLKGLSVMHRKLSLLHRDLKPANVLFDVTGVVKVADFGVSSRLEASKLEQTSTFIGSIMYMSPERVKGESYSYPSDVWALAITMTEVFLGQHPFRLHAGDEAFHGNHEKKFWKMVEIFTTAAVFDRQLAAVLAYSKKHSDDGEVMTSDIATADVALEALPKVAEAPDYQALKEAAAAGGFDLSDPRIPAQAGYVARICCKDARVPRSFADFLTRCLQLSQFQRASVVELMSHPFIQSLSAGSPEADRASVSSWLLAFVPKVATSPGLAQAARDLAAARNNPAPKNGDSPKADAAASAVAAGEEAPRNPSPPTKSAKVRAALSSLAAEPKPAAKAAAPKPKHDHTAGSIFADDTQGVGSAGCCLWTSRSASPVAPAKVQQPSAAPPADVAATSANVASQPGQAAAQPPASQKKDASDDKSCVVS